MEDTASSKPHFRLFVAIRTPEVLLAEFERLQKLLALEMSRSAVRWVKPEGFHLTLKFLGNVDVPNVEPLTGALRAACQSHPTLSLRASGIGAFPNLRRPRVLWAGVADKHGHLGPIQQAVETAVAPFTNEKAEERYHGHITLGRVNQMGSRDLEAVKRIAASLKSEVFGEWRAESVDLMRSELSPQGARHTVLAHLPLH